LFGIKDFTVLTGDNKGAAQAVASRLGIEHWEAELLPQDKVKAVEKLTESGRRVAMIGDGVNDAPALAASNLGIAMGASGSDTALETADIALMADDLTKLTYAVRIGRKAVSIIGQNITLAISLKLAFLVLALVGIANLWMAVVADMGASLLVVFNGMRVLLLKHLPHKHANDVTHVRKAEDAA
jgi:Cd2+/Zn2+-exporting ATPase